eukprot:scaffold105264_cov63-Phaeocystis_antarctica.AAC.2
MTAREHVHPSPPGPSGLFNLTQNPASGDRALEPRTENTQRKRKIESVIPTPPRARRRQSPLAARMALLSLSGDEQRIVFTQLCNVLDPRLALDLSSASHELRELTQALLQQLRADHEAAAALCLKVGMQSCKELREAKRVDWYNKVLTVADLALLGTLGSVLPALMVLVLSETSGTAGPDGVQRLAEVLGAGALPAVTKLVLLNIHVGDAGASALAAALGRGALPRLKFLDLCNAAIGDAGLVALAPALWRLPALESLYLYGNPLGDEGLAALVAPPPSPAGAPPPPTGVLTKLKELLLEYTQINDAGCAALAAALDSGALPALKDLYLADIPASNAAIDAVYEARASLLDEESESEVEDEESGSEKDEEDEEDEEEE